LKLDDSILSTCLFFTSNRFARAMTKIAEEIFSKTGISPAYSYLLVVVHQYPGITQKELCEKLSIAPSTSTRFIDKLVKLDLVHRVSEWKETHIYLTEKGMELYGEICECFSDFYDRYTSVLGETESEQLTKLIHESSEILKKEGY
jgi:DNA-binding MarR family transcriptional regulator